MESTEIRKKGSEGDVKRSKGCIGVGGGGRKRGSTLQRWAAQLV